MSIDLPESLIGQIVLFYCNSVTDGTVFELVFKITAITPWEWKHEERPNPCEIPSGINIEGNFIAGDFMRNGDFPLPCHYVKDYRILTKRDLPLLIGYKAKSDLLVELLCQ